MKDFISFMLQFALPVSILFGIGVYKALGKWW